jgi:hypothetical protein
MHATSTGPLTPGSVMSCYPSQYLAPNHGLAFAGLDTRIGGLDTRIGGLDIRIGGLDTRIGGLDTRIGGLETDVKDLKGVLVCFTAPHSSAVCPVTCHTVDVQCMATISMV